MIQQVVELAAMTWINNDKAVLSNNQMTSIEITMVKQTLKAKENWQSKVHQGGKTQDRNPIIATTNGVK